MKKRITMIALALCLCVALAVGCKKREIMEYEEEISRYPWGDILAIEHSQTGESFCIVDRYREGPIIFPGRYVIDSHAILNRKLYGRRDAYTEIEEFDVKVYDFKTLEIVKEIDMKEVLSPYANEYEAYNGGMGSLKKGGKNFLLKTLQKIQTEEEIREEKEREFVDFFYDIDTGEVEIVETDARVTTDDENIWLLIGTDILDVNGLEDIWVWNSSVLENTSYIDIPTRKLPKENEKLYGMFPELKKVSRTNGIYAHIYLTPQPNNLEVLSLVLDDNQELDFDLLKPKKENYYGSYGKDKKITEEKYQAFQKEYHEYRKREREEREARKDQGSQE